MRHRCSINWPYFRGGKWGILNTKQSIKVNDPAIHKSVTEEHCCINHPTYRLVKLRSSLRLHSISGLSGGGALRSYASGWP